MQIAPINLTSIVLFHSQAENKNTSEHPLLYTKDEAIDYIKNKTPTASEEALTAETFIHQINGERAIILSEVELQDGNKQYFLSVNIPASATRYITNPPGDPWKFERILTDESDKRKTKEAVFIFGDNIHSNHLSTKEILSTDKYDDINGKLYIFCSARIKFALDEEKLTTEEIKKKSILIHDEIPNKLILNDIIKMLDDCRSTNINCKNSKAELLTDKYSQFFERTEVITTNMQINVMKLAKELRKYQ
ncbi:hypothetical protein ACLMO3_13315 [Yersinia enterocolitica]|uniref:hypothetical protein n=1 Tax=Yersinia enterocolitica TaxID=630 RepID=UPI00398CEEF2